MSIEHFASGKQGLLLHKGMHLFITASEPKGHVMKAAMGATIMLVCFAQSLHALTQQGDFGALAIQVSET